MTAPLRPLRLTAREWLVCAVAACGFLFDSYELLMLPLIVRPALMELGGIVPGSPEFTFWFGLLFYIPAIAGGAFGLLGGYLADRFGRQRILTASIMLYACSSFLSGFAANLPMLLVLRCLVFIGVCVEFVAAVAWLAEIFPEPRRREAVLGTTQAFSSVGGLLVALAGGIAAAWAAGRPIEILGWFTLPPMALPPIGLPHFLSFLGHIANPHADWRYTLMSGLLPALPLLLVRPFLPESPPWLEKRRTGRLGRPSVAALFSPRLWRTTCLVTGMFTLSFAASFGALLQAPQIVPGLPETRAAVAEAQGALLSEEDQASLRTQLTAAGCPEGEIEQRLFSEKRRIAGPVEQRIAARVTTFQEMGGIGGRCALAVLAVWIVSRRRLLRFFLIPATVILPVTFAWAGTTSLPAFESGLFLAGFFIIGQFSFWGNYLPRVYPLHLRGTGESFAANVGGRMLGSCFAALTQWLAAVLPVAAAHPAQVAYAAAGIAFLVTLVNLIASRWLPEPASGLLPEDTQDL
ncbi:MFS transporter [Desulfovibrio sp. TomC]|uniref:MFS transporter n=1 Tax=Desulfovibrio sp. TomC TaxID=1562888 RepID=UPI000574CF6F|nr:MFS transporter [Desulfovibrio sp. TomC]KHK03401.1 putative transmembrane transport protein [Desulfovibrio sp. TomC]